MEELFWILNFIEKDIVAFYQHRLSKQRCRSWDWILLTGTSIMQHLVSVIKLRAETQCLEQCLFFLSCGKPRWFMLPSSLYQGNNLTLAIPKSSVILHRDTHRRWDQISPVFDPKCQFPEECWHYLSLLYLGQGKQLNLPHRRPAPLKFIMLFAILTKQYSQSGCETQARVHPDTEVKVNALEPAYLRLHTFLFPPILSLYTLFLFCVTFCVLVCTSK